MKNSFELLMQLLYAAYLICIDIFKNSIKPILSTTVKTLVVSLFLFLICQYVPHGIPLFKAISYIGWVTIIFVYRLITFKYDDFSTDSDESSIIENKEEIPQYLNDDIDEEELPPAPNVKPKDLKNGSTRE